MEQKPIILEMDEAKQELVQCVNDVLARHGLNCYLIEPMFAELYREIKASAQNELAQARAAEEARLKAQMAAQKAMENGVE
jgi:hypothetical protein